MGFFTRDGLLDGKQVVKKRTPKNAIIFTKISILTERFFVHAWTGHSLTPTILITRSGQPVKAEREANTSNFSIP